MKRPMAALAFAATLTLTACGNDEPEVEAAPLDDPVVETADFPTLDADGDSYLDRDEIPEGADRSLFEPWDADADSELDRDEIVGNAFELFDADGNGRISNDEWELASAIWVPDTPKVVVLADWDADGDSELDEDEFAERFDYSSLGETWGTGVLDAEEFGDAYFELYDSDDDGKVSETEFAAGAELLGAPEPG